METWAVTIPVYLAFLLLCLIKPGWGRLAAGWLLLLAGLLVNLPMAFLSPYSYVSFGSGSLLTPYRWVFSEFVASAPSLCVASLALFQILTGMAILAKGIYVRIGIIAGAGFLLVIAPLGIETLPNPLLALAFALLLRRDYDQPALPLRRTSRLARQGV